MAYFVGIIIGLVLGLTGAGGSVLAVPLFITVLVLPAQQAISLSLAVVGISAFYGVLTRLKSKEILWVPGLIFALIGSLTSPLGQWVNHQIDEIWLLSGFSLLVVAVSLRLWLQATRQPKDTAVVRASSAHIKNDSSQSLCNYDAEQPFKLKWPCFLGMTGAALLTGFLSGLFGVGGGFIIVPMLVFLLGVSMLYAVATSLFVISCVSLSGLVSFYLNGGQLPSDLLLQVGGGGVIGMTLGIVLSAYLAGPRLQKLFAVSLFGMSLFTLIKQIY